MPAWDFEQIFLFSNNLDCDTIDTVFDICVENLNLHTGDSFSRSDLRKEIASIRRNSTGIDLKKGIIWQSFMQWALAREKKNI